MSGKPNASETQNSSDSVTENLDQTSTTENPTTKTEVEEMMPRAKYLELLDEKKKQQKILKEYQEKERLAAEEKLKAEGNFNQILSEREKELLALKNENEEYKNRFKNGKKLKAFLQTVGTDLDDKWLNMIELESIQFKPESDELDPMSVSKAVEGFKKLWPEALKPKGPSLPNGAPNGSTTISESEWQKMSSKDMKKYKPEQIIWGK